MEENFTAILNSLERIEDEYEKQYAFDTLICSIKGTCLLEENFSAILNTLDKIDDDTQKRFSLSYLISAIKGKKLFKEKVTLIKGRFPEYSEKLEELLKKEENS